MSSSKWDADYNVGDLTDAQILDMRVKEQESRELKRHLLFGYMQIPYITRELLREQFHYHRTALTADSYIMSEDVDIPDAWVANKIYAVCHTCGYINSKHTIRETFKCYRCRSRYLTVLRAGMISNLILNYVAITGNNPGVDMDDVFTARKERLKALRKSKKDNHAVE